MSQHSEDLIALLIEGLDPGAMVTKFLVIAEGIDTEGQRAIYTQTNEGAQAWDNMGMLAYAMALENNALLQGDD